MEFKIKDTKYIISFGFPAIIVFFIIFDKIGLAPIFLLSIFLHEMAHIFVLLFTNKKIKEISFNLTGIAIKADTLYKNMGEEFALHFAGPFVNLFIGAITYITGKFAFFSAVNLVMGLFNLLPIGSLDGGNILSMIIRDETIEKQYKIKKAVNIVTFIPMLILGIYLFINQRGNFTLLLIAISMLRKFDLEA